MNDSVSIISNLENALQILPTIVREIPNDNLKRRPVSGKWSVHEHTYHLAEVQPVFFERLEIMLAENHPTFAPYSPDDNRDKNHLFDADLDIALENYSIERTKLVEKLKSLSTEDWQRTAEYKNFPDYSVFRMFRHLSLHDYLHIYRIEELLLKNIL